MGELEVKSTVERLVEGIVEGIVKKNLLSSSIHGSLRIVLLCSGYCYSAVGIPTSRGGLAGDKGGQ